MNTTLRDLIDRHWRELEAEQTSGERVFRVSELPVDTANGRLAAAVDHEGKRHVLVPIDAHQKTRRGLDGPVLLLRKRPLEDADFYQTYADLGCLRTDLNEIFTMLCADVLKATEAVPGKPLKALYRVLDRWRALFQTRKAPIGPDQVAGLFGELTALVRLLEKDGSAHRLWRGPTGHRHDFAADKAAIEVKTSVGAERRVRVHGLDQLEPPPDGTLQLAWYRLERASEQGEDLAELVGRALILCDDESMLLDLLATAGYHPTDHDHYRGVRFVVAEERWYDVADRFPRLTGHGLTAAGIPITVSDVAYTVDLATEPPNPLKADRVDRHLTDLIEETS